MLPKIGFILENLDFVFSRHIFGCNKNEKEGEGRGGDFATSYILQTQTEPNATCSWITQIDHQ